MLPNDADDHHDDQVPTTAINYEAIPQPPVEQVARANASDIASGTDDSETGGWPPD